MATQDGGGVRQRVKSTPKTGSSSTNTLTPKPSSRPSRNVAPPQFQLDSRVAFYVLLVSHSFAAVYSPILDCDETFNYWEPTHYLTHGHGFQTWEYSPDFAIRSWTYAGLHAVITLLARILPHATNSKQLEFYFLRFVLGFICAICGTRLFSTISTALNPRIAVTYLIIMASSSGVFHASVAYLPSSFAMYFAMLGMAAFMDWRGGLRTAQGIWCFGIAATIGWPFAGALALPYILEELLLGSLSHRQGMAELFWRLVDGVVRSLVVLALQAAIDLFFYKKFVLVPWNIVLYNVFGSGGGPDLYGTEPWHFYLRNLFLNFNVWLLLALVSMPLLLAQQLLGAKGALRSSHLRGIIFLSPFYLWLTIFTLQPHKEERFMYPAYPALALNAAVALHIILANIGSTDAKHLVSRIPLRLRLGLILTFMLGTTAFSTWRTLGTVTAYGAPLSIYQPLHQANVSRASDVVCLGKEWYRFPSHYLLPSNARAKFIKSEFSGLLPGEFSEATQGFGIFPGTWLVPPGMNDQNREDVGKYVDIKYCDFLVDSHLPSTRPTKHEPSHILDQERWERVKCLPFLDAASTGIVGRLGWVPDLPFIPSRFRRSWGEYCLLRRRTKVPADVHADVAPQIETML